MKNLYSSVKIKISKIILKIVCWHIFKAFLAKKSLWKFKEVVFYEVNFIIILFFLNALKGQCFLQFLHSSRSEKTRC
jgi:ABC-type uncharacterized transport system permease subunit